MKRKRDYRAPWQMSRNVAQVVHNAAFERSIEQMSRTNISYFRAKKKRPAETETPVGRTENISLI